MTLPNGFTVRLAAGVRVRGTTLVGGTPTTAVRLRDPWPEGPLAVSDDRSAALAGRLLDLGLVVPVNHKLPMRAADDLTVVVPVRDRPVALGRLLDSVDSGHPVVVVDDGSRDPRAVEAACAGRADVVRLEVNRGPGAARNAGLAKVSTPYVAFVDSDVQLTPGVLRELSRHLWDPKVAVVAPRVRGRGNGRPTWFARYDAARSSLDLGPRPASVHPRSRVSWLPAACLVARTDALGAGFEPSLRVGEDVDLVWRLVKEGRRVRYEPACTVFHEARTSPWEVLGRKFTYGTSAGVLASRHGVAVAPAVLAPWSVATIGLLVSGRPGAAAALTGLVGVRIGRRLPLPGGGLREGTGLAAKGVVAAGSQLVDLGLRHWWPLSVALAAASPRARRMLLAAAVADAVCDYLRVRPELDVVRFTLARRLDDVAYGAGVWVGAVGSGQWRALLPEWPRPRKRRTVLAEGNGRGHQHRPPLSRRG